MRAAVIVAAALLGLELGLLAVGVPAHLVPPWRWGALASWPRIHTRLALIEPSDALASDTIRAASVVLWVSASADPNALAHPGGGACFIVSPFPRARAEVLFTVAGCAVQRSDQRAPAAA